MGCRLPDQDPERGREAGVCRDASRADVQPHPTIQRSRHESKIGHASALQMRCRGIFALQYLQGRGLLHEDVECRVWGGPACRRRGRTKLIVGAQDAMQFSTVSENYEHLS